MGSAGCQRALFGRWPKNFCENQSVEANFRPRQAADDCRLAACAPQNLAATAGRRHLNRRGLWLRRVFRFERRRIYHNSRWLFFLSGLDSGGKGGIEHRQSNGFGENGDCT